MADREDGQSSSRYFSRKKCKRAKPQVVELSDSSSECNDDNGKLIYKE